MRRETVHSELSQDEKRATLQNDQLVHKNTFHSHTHPDEGGRFAASDQPPRHVVGATAVPHYPVLPASSPWHDDPVPPEGPSDVDLSAPVVGEAHEIEQSLQALAESQSGEGINPSLPPNGLPNGEGVPPGGVLHASVLKRPRHHSKHKKGLSNAPKRKIVRQ